MFPGNMSTISCIMYSSHVPKTNNTGLCSKHVMSVTFYHLLQQMEVVSSLDEVMPEPQIEDYYADDDLEYAPADDANDPTKGACSIIYHVDIKFFNFEEFQALENCTCLVRH